jgi:hypothetical protein
MLLLNRGVIRSNRNMIPSIRDVKSSEGGYLVTFIKDNKVLSKLPDGSHITGSP